VDEFENALEPRINGEKDKGPLLATLGLVSIVVAIAVVVVVNYIPSSENPPRDLEPPLVVIEGIQQTYQKGNNGFYNIRITDNNELAAFSFSIKNTDIIYKSTTLDGKKEYEYNGSFSTDDWKTGQYTYISTGEDKAGNLTKKEGSFWVKAEIPFDIKKAECILRLRICDDVEP
jgi:hypothetical protein